MASFSQHAGENWLLKKKMDSEGKIHAPPPRRGSTPVLHTLHMTKYFTPTGDGHEHGGGGGGGGGGDMVVPCPQNPSPDSARCTSSLSNGSLESTRDLDMFECLSDGGHSNSDSVSLFSKSSPSPVLSPFLEESTGNSSENGTFDLRYATAYTGVQGDESDNPCSGDSSSSGYHPKSNEGADCDDDDYGGGSAYGPDLYSAPGPRTPDSLSLPSRRSCSSDCSVDGQVMRGNNSILMETDQAHSISYLTESAGSPAAASDVGMPCDPSDSPTIEAKRLRLGDELLNPHDRTYCLGKGAGPSPSPRRGAAGGGLKSRGPAQGHVTLPSGFAFATPESCRPGASAARRQQPPGSARRSGENMTTAEKTFVVSPRGDADGTRDMQTSTPLQSLNNNTYSLPSFDESPFTKAETGGGGCEGSRSNAPQEQPGSRTAAKADGGGQKQAGSGDANATFVVKSTEAAPKVKKFSRPNLTSVKTKFMLSKQSSAQKPAKQNGETRTLARVGDRAPRKPSPLTLGKPAASLSKSSTSPLPTPTGSTAQPIKAEAPPSGKQESRAQKRFVFPKTRQRLPSDDTAATAKPSPDEKQQSAKTSSPNFITKVYKAVTQSKVLPEKQQKLLKQKQSDRKGSASSQEDAAAHKQSKATVGFQSERPKTSPMATCSKPVTGPLAAAAATPARVAPPPGAGASGVKRAGAAVSEGRKGKLGAWQSPSSRCNRAAPAPASTPASTPASPAARAQAGSSRQPPSSMTKLRLGSSNSNQASSSSRDIQPTSYGDAFNTGGGGGGRAALSKASGVTTRSQAAAATKTTTKTPATTTAAKSTASSIKPASSTTQRKLPARPTRTLTPQSVDKGKARPNPRSQSQNQNQVNGHRGAEPPSAPLDNRVKNKAQNAENHAKNQIQGLKGVLHQSNVRCEGLAVVLQHCLAERDETLKKYADLSQELVNLREELVNSSQTCERLAVEKEEVGKMREQHRLDLAQLEERLRGFYAAEWDKTHQMYQEEADKCKAQMEDQLKALQRQHEALMSDLEASHLVKMEAIKQQAEQSLAELTSAQDKQLETLNTTLHEIDNLTGQVEELKSDNVVLNEKLTVAEELRKKMAAETQDSHTLYLEQELESLKVVLDIKSKQLQQQDQKIMQMEKVLEKNEKLEKSLQMIQRENEDLKARMDRHVSLARQLSADQMMMQENLEKESKMNKRLSRENEELLWKLHNGDLNLTRKSPPATPSSLPLQSP